MKNYDQFLNEKTVTGDFNPNLPIGFKFVVDFSESTEDQIYEFFDKIKKYFNFKDKTILYYIFDNRSSRVVFEISLLYTGYLELYFEIYYDSYPGRTVDQKFSNTIALQDFLMVGFEGVKKFIKMKNIANKYNI